MAKLTKLMTMVVMAVVCIASASPASAMDENWEKFKKSGVLTVGTSPDYPPFESMNPDTNEIEGFDIDLINAVGAELGLKTEFKSMGFDSIIIAVKNKQVNLGMSSFSVTEERKQSVDFTIPYFKNGSTVLTTANSDIKTVEDLVGKRVSAQIGSTSAEAAKKIKGAEAQIVDDANIAVMMVKNGAVQGAVLDMAIAENYAKKPEFKLFIKPLTYEETAAIVRKGSPEFLEALNKAIKKLEADGTIDKLRVKWDV
jgi:polar amino acid transport system substrate-binding protein